MPSQLWASLNSDQQQQGIGYLELKKLAQIHLKCSPGTQQGMVLPVVGKVHYDSSQYSDFVKHGQL